MKHSKRLVALLSFLILLISLMPMSLAASPNENITGDKIGGQVLNEVTALFTNVYTISDASYTVQDKSVDKDGNTVYTIDVSFKRTLKATSATETPLVQGLLAAKAQLTDPAEISTADEYITARVKDLNDNYIGVAQDTTGTFIFTLPPLNHSALGIYNTIDVSNIVMESESGDEVVPAASVAPRSASEQIQAGESLLADVISAVSSSSIANNSLLATPPHNANILLYDRVSARNYARSWSCTLGITGEHSTCHNSNYSYLTTDCANFVSQCLHEGGLPTDGTWYPYSSYWISTGNNGNGLRQYVVNNDLFFHTTNINKAFAGSIINLLNSDGTNHGHVGLISQNDGSTVTLCAHDSCRKDYLVSNWANKDYFVPYWDSYGGVWVTP